MTALIHFAVLTTPGSTATAARSMNVQFTATFLENAESGANIAPQCVASGLDFVFKMVNAVFKMMNFVLKMMNPVFKMLQSLCRAVV